MKPHSPFTATRAGLDHVLNADEADKRRIDELIVEQSNGRSSQVSAEVRRQLCEHRSENEGENDPAGETQLLTPRTLGPAPDLEDHDVLVEVANQYLKEVLGCGFSFAEFHASTGNGEVPDAIGWAGLKSVLIECKTSRSDFHADKEKEVRKNPEEGVGLFRLYMTPKGVLQKDDLPPQWGLVEVEEHRGQVRTVRTEGPTGDLFGWRYQYDWMHQRNIKAERLMHYAALRRFEIRDLIPKVT